MNQQDFISIFNKNHTEVLNVMDWANVILFIMLLAATIVLAIILKLFQHHKPADQRNILVLLQSYLSDALLAFNLSMIIPVLICQTAGPMSRITAELIMLTIYVLACFIIILTAASSLIKLLLVVKFNLVFSVDEQKLAKMVLYLTTCAALLPHLAFTLLNIFALLKPCKSTVVAYFMGNPDVKAGWCTGTIYLLVILAICFILLGLVVFWIPVYLKQAHNNTAIRE